ncbi:MAG TPA: pyruvate kinase [Phycisphaerae bacterium]|jgi:pyruvate kinase|nr:pyruvate kinase [Phycisphaerae bacterium]
MNKPRTKIVVTLGPACANPEVFSKMVDAGVAVARLNFSHGSHEQKKQYLEVVRSCSKRPVAIMADLCGPKIRVGTIENNAMPLAPGDVVTVQREPVIGRDKTFSSNYACLVDDLEVGQRVLIDDGSIRMIVTEKSPNAIHCQVTHGGTLQSNKGFNLPNTKVNLPSITDKDWADVDFAIDHKLDYIALSFVRAAEDVRQLRKYLDARNAKIHIISKIEMPQAVRDLAAIVEASDAVLVARGDLGVEMDLTQVPIIQKEIILAAHEAGKPVIVATQMLQTMVDNPSPTRAEVSDVANAILDGADAVMLSGETAVGKYPVGAVLVLTEIAAHTEDYTLRKGIAPPPPKLLQMIHHRTAAIAHGAKAVVDDINARLVVVWSQAGGSARYISKHRFGVPVVALSTDPAAVRRMALYFGIIPLQATIPGHFDDLPLLVDEICETHKLAEPGERAVICAGAPLGIVGVTNSLSVHTVGRVS